VEVRVNKKKRLVFAAMAVVMTLVLTTAVVIAGDVYLHYKYADSYGLNIWGYRGPVIGDKQPNERRLVVLGESTAFGYGVPWNEAIPVYLEAALRSGSPAPVSVVNLAYNNEGAHSYKFTLRDYEYLDYDAVIFYSGYNNLGGPNTSVFRHTSAIFRTTGYMPLFPIIAREKAMVLRGGGEVGALENAHLGDKTTFRPNITARATASALETAVRISNSLDAQLAREPETFMDTSSALGQECGARWAHYCGGMYEAVKIALDGGKRVLIATQPYMNADHIEQQRTLRAFLQRKFNDDPRLQFADMGTVVDLKDPSLAYDGMHLTAEGNRRIAAALVPAVRELIK
jgi:hypothetical protein